MQLDLNKCSSYKSQTRAIVKARKVIPYDVKWLVAVNDRNEFVIVVVLQPDQMYQAIAFARAGCYVWDGR